MKLKQINYFLTGAMLLAHAIGFSQSVETRKLSPFTSVEVSGSIETILEEGKEESIVIEVKGADTRKIITEVSGTTLQVKLEKGNNYNVKTKVFITFKTLASIACSGSGKLLCNDDLSAADFNLISSGSGMIVLNGKITAKRLHIVLSGSNDIKLKALAADDCKIVLSGSGDVHIDSGNVKKERLNIAGSGDIHISGLSSEHCTVNITGSGNANVTVESTIESTIIGSGDVNYKGNAVIKNQSSIGSGRIRKQ